MHLTASVFFVILAIVLFLVGLILAFVSGVDPKIIEVCLLGGLASFAAVHLPIS